MFPKRYALSQYAILHNMREFLCSGMKEGFPVLLDSPGVSCNLQQCPVLTPRSSIFSVGNHIQKNLCTLSVSAGDLVEGPMKCQFPDHQCREHSYYQRSQNKKAPQYTRKKATECNLVFHIKEKHTVIYFHSIGLIFLPDIQKSMSSILDPSAHFNTSSAHQYIP